MLISHNREKLLNAVIYFSKKTKYFGKTKMMKLLYFLDFFHFRQTGKSVTGLDYYTLDFGPVPKKFYEEIKKIDKLSVSDDLKQTITVVKTSGEFQQIKARKRFSAEHFSKRELRLLKHIAFIFKYAKAADIKEITHLRNTPYDKTLKEKGQDQKIDYMLALDDSQDSLPKEIILERQAEMKEMKSVFSHD